MSPSSRLISAFFTALPGLFFFLLFLLSSWFGREYWWETYLVVLLVLLTTSLASGFALPMVFQKLKWRYPWLRIFMQGLLGWGLALVVLGLLNATPLCVGQNNGDGNNDLGMCMFMTILSGMVYTPLYLGMLVLSAVAGHWVLRTYRQPV